jgi:hypothetical protein
VLSETLCFQAVQWAEATVAWAEKRVDAVKERDDDG